MRINENNLGKLDAEGGDTAFGGERSAHRAAKWPCRCWDFSMPEVFEKAPSSFESIPEFRAGYLSAFPGAVVF